MNKKELIEGIQNLEFESEDGAYQRGFDSAKYWCLTLAGYLVESEAEKVEVPPMIDKFIKDHTDPIFEICAWSDYYGNDGRTCDDPELSVVLDWYGNNTTEFYEAVVNGYAIQPKRWVVKVNGRTLKYLQIRKEGTPDPLLKPFFENGSPMAFTDKTKAEAVATLVDGNVEEV